MKQLITFLLALISLNCISQPTVSIQGPTSVLAPATSAVLKGVITLNAGTTLITSGWSQPVGQSTTIADNSTTTTVNGLTNGPYTFTLSVVDSKGLKASASITITAIPSSITQVVPIGTMITNSIDSLIHTLDSEVVKTYSTLNANIGPTDTLVIPVNTVALYKVRGICTDPTTKEVGITEKWLVVKNLNGVYSIPSPIITPFTYTGGGSLVFSGWTIVLVANMLILKIQVPIGKPVDWQFSYTKDVKPL